MNFEILFEYQWIYDSDQLKLKGLIEKQSKMEKVVYDYKEALKKVEIKFKQFQNQLNQSDRVTVHKAKHSMKALTLSNNFNSENLR